jgi:hypothetical protein
LPILVLIQELLVLDAYFGRRSWAAKTSLDFEQARQRKDTQGNAK